MIRPVPIAICGIMLAALSGRAAPPAQSAAPACIDIRRHGADPTGMTDSAAAFTRAAAASNPRAICVRLPAGTYRFAASPAVTLGSAPVDRDAAIAILGDGAGLTRLRFDPGISGPTLHLNEPEQSVHIRNLSILAGGATPGTTGLAIVQTNAPAPNPAQSDITGVIIRGSDGFGARHRFARGLSLRQVSSVTIADTLIAGSPDGAPYATAGTCLELAGTAAAIPAQITIVASQINHCGRGLVYGPYVQGVQITASNFTGNGTAIHQPAGNIGNDQLAISASQFNSGLHDILLEAPIDGVTIAASTFYLAEGGAAAIALRGVQFAIQGNSFIGLGRARGTAIAVGDFLLDAGIVTGNSFNNFQTAVVLGRGSSRVNVQSNAYSDIADTPVVDRGTGNRVGGGSP